MKRWPLALSVILFSAVLADHVLTSYFVCRLGARELNVLIDPCSAEWLVSDVASCLLLVAGSLMLRALRFRFWWAFLLLAICVRLAVVIFDLYSALALQFMSPESPVFIRCAHVYNQAHQGF